MTPLDAVILGILQGLTEFLPISSTAHLTLGGRVLGLITPDRSAAWTAYIAVIQLGTLAAVVLFFRTDVRVITGSLTRDLVSNGGGRGWPGYRNESRLGIFMAVGTLPVVLAGLLLKDLIHSMFTKSLVVIAVSLVTLALLLWAAERAAAHRRRMDDLTWVDALVVGAAQALALIPGASRSGTTLTAGLFLGFERAVAARFSFLLSIPAVLLSGVYELLTVDSAVLSFGVGNILLGMSAAAVSGYAAIAWLLKFLGTHTTMVFVWYRIGLGLLLGALLLAGVLLP